MTDDSGPLHDGKDEEPGAAEAGPAEPINAAALRLLIGYGEALDSIAAKPAIVLPPPLSAPQRWFGRRAVLPGAYAIARILGEAHVAARVDALLRRGRRFRALDLPGRSPLDLGRLEDFRDSLSPVRRRTLALWLVLSGLAVSFPVAWITDYLRALAPEAIVCSRFSIRDDIAKFAGTANGPAPTGCRGLRSEASLVEALLRITHLNLTPGGVIDALLVARTNGLVVVLLLAVVGILSLCVALLAFRSGFRLKRLAFSVRPPAPADGGWLLRSEGLYRLEQEVFTAVGLPYRPEFPLDLAVSFGMLVLPLTIAADLLATATLPKLDLITTAMLALAALAVIAVVFVRVQWLLLTWRSRTGLAVVPPRVRGLPDGSTVQVRRGAFGAVLLAAGYIAMEMTALADPSISGPLRIASLLFFAPVVAWPLSMLWWYRLHRELASCGRCAGLALVRAPILCLVPSLSIAVALVIFFSTAELSGLPNSAFGLAIFVGLAGVPASLYRMGRRLHQLRLGAAPRRDWKAHAAGLRAVAMLIVPVVAILYFQRSLNRISLEIAASASPSRTAAPAGTLASVRRLDATPRRRQV